MITLKRSALDAARLAEARAVAPQPERDYAGVVIEKPWGCEWEEYRNEALSCWSLDLACNAETSLHCHPAKTTVLVVNAGVAYVSTLAERHCVRAGDVVVIEPGVFHRTQTEGGCVLTEIECPPDKQDLVRLEDLYGREGQPYEASGERRAAR